MLRFSMIRNSVSRLFIRSHSKMTQFGYDQVSEEEKQQRVNDVFTSVAERYDLMNDIMSVGIHRLWKDYFIRSIRPKASWKYIDVAGGTGDIAFRYLKEVDRIHVPSSPTKCVVADINPNMLAVGRQRALKLQYGDRIDWVEANAEKLPFENDQFDIYTIAFGIRNCTHVDRVVAEAYRVLRKGGRFLCLEFSQVNNTLLRYLYDEYSKNVIPPMGQIIANDWKSYQYLIESIRVFPNQIDFARLIRSCGFEYVNYENLSFGIAAIHSGFKV